jgi:hypothetical protein
MGVLPYNILCEQYYATKPLTQDMHKVSVLALEMVNKNYFTANMSKQKKSVAPYLLAKTPFCHLPNQTS